MRKHFFLMIFSFCMFIITTGLHAGDTHTHDLEQGETTPLGTVIPTLQEIQDKLGMRHRQPHGAQLLIPTTLVASKSSKIRQSLCTQLCSALARLCSSKPKCYGWGQNF